MNRSLLAGVACSLFVIAGGGYIFLKADGSIGAGEEPDPKMLIVGGVMYLLRRP